MFWAATIKRKRKLDLVERWIMIYSFDIDLFFFNLCTLFALATLRLYFFYFLFLTDHEKYKLDLNRSEGSGRDCLHARFYRIILTWIPRDHFHARTYDITLTWDLFHVKNYDITPTWDLARSHSREELRYYLNTRSRVITFTLRPMISLQREIPGDHFRART